MASPVRPGIVGRAVRCVLALAVGWLGIDTALDVASYADGIDDPMAVLPVLLALVVASSWVLNELLQRDWGQRPLLVLVGGAALMAGVGGAQGDPLGPPLGVYVWAWVMLFSLLLAPALLLAAILATPGCEMRSYAHARALRRGRDVEAVTCPGWIDRLDNVRVRGR